MPPAAGQVCEIGHGPVRLGTNPVAAAEAAMAHGRQYLEKLQAAYHELGGK